MLKVNFWLKRLIKEWLFLTATVGVVVTSIYLRRFPSYSAGDFRILLLIFLFLVVLKGLENTQLLYHVASSIGKGRYVHFKLVFLVAVLSMFFTNDISLLMIVPLTLAMDVKHKEMIVILEAIAANAGSALLPSGNPQNMFIYWFFNLSLSEFVKEIYPFTLISLAILFVFMLFMKPSRVRVANVEPLDRRYIIYLLLLGIMLGVVLKILPIYLSAVVALYVILFDREALKIDYFLLGIFFMFFGFTDNLQHIIKISSGLMHGVFVLSAVLSQLISNVPAALLLGDFTHNWRHLLWGVSVGGYGNLIGSLANLIAYRIYVSYESESRIFLVRFLAVGYFFYFVMFFIYMAYFR